MLSRNQPSNAQFIFGPSTWIRGLIKPPPNCAVAYVDWEQQEFGIAAALSDDWNMKEAYRSGAPILLSQSRPAWRRGMLSRNP
jgi:DNA polymerase-1